MYKSNRYFVLLAVFFLTACSVTVANPLSTSNPRVSPPPPTPTIDRLAVPALSQNPNQLEQGSYYYKQVCMACHGDRGQGLTDEWRQEWKEDYNCWQSECHSATHPPWGFEIPKTCCPAVSGPGTLMRFDTAADLYVYLVKTMPWWSPGYRSAEEYWHVTAYLLHVNNVLPAGVELNAANAMVINLRPSTPPPGNVRPMVVLLIIVLVMAAGLVAIQNRWFYKTYS
jgi:cytochrome c5